MGSNKPRWLGWKCIRYLYPRPIPVSLVLLFWTSSLALYAADGEGNLPSNSNGPPGLEQTDSSAAFLKRQALLPLIYRDRPQAFTLQQAEQAFQNQQPLEAIQYLQHLFDAPGDSFHWPNGLRSPVSLRTAARKLFLHQDRSIWETYHKLYEPEAASLLQQASETNQTELYEQVVRRYPFTSSGQQAQFYLAQFAFDRCRFQESEQRVQELFEIRNSQHSSQSKNDPLHSLSLAQHKLLQMITLVRSEVEPVPESSSKTTSLAMNSIETRWDVPVLEGTYRTATNGLANTQLVSHFEEPTFYELTPPYLKSLWDRPLVSADQSILKEMLVHWESGQRKELQSNATAWQPVVHNGVLYFRDYEGIEAVHLETGKSLWKTPTSTRFSVLLEGYRPHSHTRSRTQIAQLISELNLDQILVGNNLLGQMSIDENHLYFIDDVDLMALKSPVYARSSRHFSSQRDEAREKQKTNRLVALPLNAETVSSTTSGSSIYSVKPAWTQGGRAKSGQESTDLAGHFFLGAPLVSQNRLYALTEKDQQINLVVLNARNGRLLWSQGLAWVEKTIDQDDFRGHRAATPIEVDGVLICPCQTGILVAVEKLTGTLLWVYDYRDSLHERSQRRWASRGKTLHGHLGFDDRPLVSGGKVFHLPAHSDYLHALNRIDGGLNWKIPRKDGEYIGEITSDMVLVVGRRYCRGLSTTTGEELWSLRTGIPSGRGVSGGNHYYLPLQSGCVVTINMQTGLKEGMSHLLGHAKLNRPESNEGEQLASDKKAELSWSPGNLIAHHGQVVSVSGNEVSLFSQAGVVQEQLQQHKSLQELAPEELFRSATVLMTLNRLPEAQAELEKYFSYSRTYHDQAQYELAADLFRELLYTRLHSIHGGTTNILTQLDELVKTPQDQGRLLMEQARIYLFQEQYEEAWHCTELLSQLDLNTPLPSLRDATHVGTPTSWVPKMRNRILQLAPEAFRQQVLYQRERNHLEILTSNDLHQIRRYLTLYDQDLRSEVMRFKYADLLQKTGAPQQAELQWLHQMKNSSSRETVQKSRRMLYSLWTQHGMHQEATVMRREWESDSSGQPWNLKVAGSTTDAEGTRLSDSVRRLCLAQQQELEKPVTKIRISENRWNGLPEKLDGYRRVVPTSLNCDYSLITRGSGHTGKLAVLDRLSGKLVEQMEVPSGTLSQQLGRHQLCGHVIAMGGNRNAIGISLLTRQKLWELDELTGMKKESLRIGPVTPLYTVVRNRHQLAVLESGTGKLIWQRNEIAPPGTQINTGQAGVIGDERAVITFEKQSNYNVYDITNGEEIRQGKLRIDAGERHYVFGRKMFYHEPTNEGNLICLYDPLENRYVFRRPATGPVFSTRTSDNELAILAAMEQVPGAESVPYRLEIIDPKTDQIRLKHVIQEEDAGNLSFFRVFSDRDHFYVNLQHHNSSLNLPRQYYPAGDSLLKNITIRGDLLAFEKSTGKMLWRRTFQPCSVLMLEPYRLPCLVMLSRTRDKVNPNRHSLAVEAVDMKTGRRLGFHEEILTDRLIHANYDPEGRFLSLFGHRTEVRLDFETENLRDAILLQSTRTL